MPFTLEVFREDFEGCPDPLDNGWNGWTVVGDIQCGSTGWNCPDSTDILASDQEMSWIERYVDLSSLDENVVMCFEAATETASTADELEVEIDSGSGWQRVWWEQDDLGPNRLCDWYCVGLSDHDPAVNNNPNLGIRFTLDGDHNDLMLDNIVITGVQHCPGTGQLVIGPITDNGDGTYTFTARDIAGPMYPDIMCTWGEAVLGVTEIDPVRFY